MNNANNPVIINGMDVEEIAEALVNGEGYNGLSNLKVLAAVLNNDELAEAVYADIKARWDEATAHKVMIG
jgi:hypothetical protein